MFAPSPMPAEQVAPTTTEAEAPKVETKTEAETGEPAEGNEAPETTEAVEGQEPGEGQKHSSVERRIRRLSAKLAAAAEENQALRELAFSKRDQADSQAQAPAQASAPAGKPRAEDFDNVADFAEALTDWKLEQRAVQARQSQVQGGFNAKVEAFKAGAPDYVEAVSEILPMINDQIRDLVLESDVGPEVLYRLANSEAELDRFAKMSPVRKLAYVAALETQILTNKTQRRAAPPAPPTRVTATPAAKADDVASSYAEWKARREAAKRK